MTTVCPTCKEREKASGASYCNVCRSIYQKKRNRCVKKISVAEVNALKMEIVRLRTLMIWHGVNPDAS